MEYNMKIIRKNNILAKLISAVLFCIFFISSTTYANIKPVSKSTLALQIRKGRLEREVTNLKPVRYREKDSQAGDGAPMPAVGFHRFIRRRFVTEFSPLLDQLGEDMDWKENAIQILGEAKDSSIVEPLLDMLEHADDISKQSILLPVIMSILKRLFKRSVVDLSLIGRWQEPPIPLAAHVPRLYEGAIERWIEEDSSDPQIKQIKEKVAANITHISFSEFKTALDGTITSLNQHLRENDAPYAVVWDPWLGRSRRWVYSLSKENLCRNPTLTTYFPHYTEIEFKKGRVLQQAIDQDIGLFVIIDDAAFSGDQIKKTVTQIATSYDERGLPKPTFIISVPYMSSAAIDSLKSISSANIIILYEHRVRSIEEILSPEERTVVMARPDCFGHDVNSGVERFTATFDHSIPDARSLSRKIATFIDRGDYMQPYNDPKTAYFKQEVLDYIAYQVFCEAINDVHFSAADHAKTGSAETKLPEVVSFTGGPLYRAEQEGIPEATPGDVVEERGGIDSGL